MTQDRWPDITTSVSGISRNDWDIFKLAARRRELTYRAAMEHAIGALVADIRAGRKIEWMPARPAAGQSIKLHADTLDQVRELAAKVGYRHNVVIGTAMHRWVGRV